MQVQPIPFVLEPAEADDLHNLPLVIKRASYQLDKG